MIGADYSSSYRKKKKRKDRDCKEEQKFVIKTDRNELGDYTSEEEEDEQDYRKGGYHPVKIGCIFNDRYEVVKKLGWGHFSTVWLAKDLVNNNVVALKIVKSARHYTEAARDEISILKKIKREDPYNDNCVVHLIDSFEHSGTNGNHVCMAFESLGCNLLTLIKLYRHRGIPIPLVKILSKQILIGLDFLHRKCSIIHTDLKPENILLHKYPKITPSYHQDNNTRYYRKRYDNLPRTKKELLESFGDGAYRCKIVDLGNACWTYKHFTDDVQTRQYRAPEVILGYKYDTAIDIWSMACIVFELLTGDLLFEPKNGKRYDKNDDHLAQIIELLGKFPTDFAINGEESYNYFTRRGELRNITNLSFWGLEDVLIEKYEFKPDDAKMITSFLKPMLEYIPRKRATARACLRHPWIRNVDIYNFESAFDDDYD